MTLTSPGILTNRHRTIIPHLSTRRLLPMIGRMIINHADPMPQGMRSAAYVHKWRRNWPVSGLRFWRLSAILQRLQDRQLLDSHPMPTTMITSAGINDGLAWRRQDQQTDALANSACTTTAQNDASIGYDVEIVNNMCPISIYFAEIVTVYELHFLITINIPFGRYRFSKYLTVNVAGAAANFIL